MLPHSAFLVKRESGETDIWRPGITDSRVSGIQNKRNHAIGHSEFDQLNLRVTESVLHWVSCTDIPTTPSLRLSPVCLKIEVASQRDHYSFGLVTLIELEQE